MESGVEFVAPDMPFANSSVSTSWQPAAQARGTWLGTPDPAAAVKRMGEALKAKTNQFAANVLWPAPPISKNALIGTAGSTAT
jgi:hypothetical protein